MDPKVSSEIASQYAEEAAFLWTTRRQAVGEPHYSLEELAALDERVEAHLDGLRLAGDEGWRQCQMNVADDGAGEVFALAVLAFGAGDRRRMREALMAGCQSPEAQRGLVSALGWLDEATVSPWLLRLLAAESAVHRAIGVAACAIRREDPGGRLALALGDADPGLRARALRGVGELKRHDLLDRVRDHVADEDAACRFWAGWTLTLQRDRAGLANLASWLDHSGQFGRHALQLSLRAMGVEEGRNCIREMVKDPGRHREAVIGAGVLGDPSSVPWLVGMMEVPELAPPAGEAFEVITGVDLEDEGLDQDGPGGEEADETALEDSAELNIDSHLPWPDPAKVGEWWTAHRRDFRRGTRYLSGRPVTIPWAREVLRLGKQRQRAAAAIELSLREQDEPLFEVRARGVVQQGKLLGATARR